MLNRTPYLFSSVAKNQRLIINCCLLATTTATVVCLILLSLEGSCPPLDPATTTTTTTTTTTSKPKLQSSCGAVSKDPSGQPLGGGNGYSPSNLITRNSFPPKRTYVVGDYDVETKSFYHSRVDIQQWRSSSNFTSQSQSIMMVVRNLIGLGGAIQASQPGDVIYIAARKIRLDAKVEGRILDNFDGATVHTENVTIASGRGQNGSEGALLYITSSSASTGDSAWTRLLRATANNFRVTGLRFRGPHMERDHGDDAPWVSGLVLGSNSSSSVAENIMVDNCEFSGFSEAAVQFVQVSNAKVFHSHFHHNRRETSTRKGGYGVGLSGKSDVEIVGNFFDKNRHDVSGTGDSNQMYSASYNVVGYGGTSGSFDLHGQCEAGSLMDIKCTNMDGGSDRAGQALVVNYNLFLPRVAEKMERKDVSLSESKYPAVIVRGTPRSFQDQEELFSDSGAIVQFNCFASTSDDLPIQRVEPKCSNEECTTTYLPRPFEDASIHADFHVAFNEFDSRPQDHLRWVMKSGNAKNGGSFVPTVVSRPSREAHDGLWQVNGRGFDVDGDGKEDLISTFSDLNGDLQTWYSLSARSEWKKLYLIDYEKIANSKFGDFNGDGKTDAVTINENGELVVSYGMTEEWTLLNPLCNLDSGVLNMSKLEAGMFTEDGLASVFRATADFGNPTGKWQICNSRTTSGWESIQTSKYGISSLTFVDLNGDGVLDMAITSNAKWFAVLSKANGRKTGWVELPGSPPLHISDVKWAKNGLGKSFGLYALDGDIHRAVIRDKTGSGEIMLSTSVDENLMDELSYHGVTSINELYIADVDGDGISDLTMHNV